MLEVDGLVALVVLVFWLWAIFDVISTDESLVRNLPKGMWLMLVIFLSDIGAIAWLLLGRPQNAGFAPGDTRPRQPGRRILGPEDASGFSDEPDSDRKLRELRAHYAALDAELDRRLEAKKALEEPES